MTAYPTLEPHSDAELHYYISKLTAAESECRVLRKRLQEVDFLRAQKAELVHALKEIVSQRGLVNDAVDIATNVLDKVAEDQNAQSGCGHRWEG